MNSAEFTTNPVPEAVSWSYVSVAVTSTTLGSIRARTAASDSDRGRFWPSCRMALAARCGAGAWANGRSSTMPPAPSAMPNTTTSTGISIRLRGPGSIGITFRIFPVPRSAHSCFDQQDYLLGGQAGNRRRCAGGLLRGGPDNVDGGSLRVELRDRGFERGLR